MITTAIANRPSERASFDPLSAGGVLLGVLFACVGIGALVGWALDAVGIGIAVGAVVGIPASTLVVYRTFRSAF